MRATKNDPEQNTNNKPPIYQNNRYNNDSYERSHSLYRSFNNNRTHGGFSQRNSWRGYQYHCNNDQYPTHPPERAPRSPDYPPKRPKLASRRICSKLDNLELGSSFTPPLAYNVVNSNFTQISEILCSSTEEHKKETKYFRDLTRKFGFNELNKNFALYLYQCFYYKSKTLPIVQRNVSNSSDALNTNSKAKTFEQARKEYLVVVQKNCKILHAAILNLTSKITEMKLTSFEIANTLIMDDDDRRTSCSMESIISEFIDFNFDSELPHDFLCDLIDLFEFDKQMEKEFVCKLAFGFCNDSMLNYVCVYYSPVLICFVCILLGISFFVLDKEIEKEKQPRLMKKEVGMAKSIYHIDLVKDVKKMILINYEEIDKRLTKKELDEYDIYKHV
eukprot:GAHX01001769.1.p1 GENE.GAHX01001769.1~~GAHX01001769.1.p1  ORF type:complete len:389 (+),score=66.10 GAHX01001769.1:761-1927(+)